ncbi:MAG: hypothetical protein HY808_14190 [Nitrospirae bacterium]|nr:hypothetical protein [Nitrospirota bacterium]
MSNKWIDIGTLLLEYGLINNDDLLEGLKLQKESGLRLGEALVKLGRVSMDDIDWVLSKQLDIPFVIVEDIVPNLELLSKFEKDFLIGNRILPLYETDDQISIVAEDPLNKTAIGFIEDSFSKKVNVSTGSGSKIEELLKNTFKDLVLPDLLSALKNITERIKGTSFYRIDFLLAEHACKISIFGSGILKNMMTIKGAFSKEDICSAFDEMKTPFLYDHASNGERTFLTAYPLKNKFDMPSLPAITGEYGLMLPGDIFFADAHVHGLHKVFHFDNPVHGYNYFLTKRNTLAFEKSVYVIDAAPEDLKKCYVKIFVPSKCPSCSGTGCAACKGLGYEFQKFEGMYSSGELRERLNKG